MLNMKSSLLIIAVRTLSIIGQIGFIKIYTHYLAPTELGQFYFYSTISYFLNALLFIPVDYFQQAEVFKLVKNKKTLRSLIQLNTRLLSIVGGVSTVISIIVMAVNISLFYIFAIIILSSVLLYISTAIKNFLNNQGNQLFVVTALIAEIMIKMIIFVELARYGFGGPLTLMISTAFAMLVVAIILIPKVKTKLSNVSGDEEQIDFLKVAMFCWPISLSAILNWIQLQGYRLVLVPLGYAEQVGLYATMSSVGSTGMTAAATVYQQVYLPRVYQSSGEYIRTYIKGASAVVVLVLAVGLVLRVEIVGLVTRKSFVEYAWLVGYGIVVDAGNFVIGALSVQLTITGKTTEQVKANLLGSLSIPLVYLALYSVGKLNTFSMGIPLVISQLLIVTFLLIKSKLFYSKPLTD